MKELEKIINETVDNIIKDNNTIGNLNEFVDLHLNEILKLIMNRAMLKALKVKNLKLFYSLINKGADINYVEGNDSVVSILCSIGRIDLLPSMLEFGCNILRYPDIIVNASIKANREDIFIMLIELGLDYSSLNIDTKEKIIQNFNFLRLAFKNGFNPDTNLIFRECKDKRILDIIRLIINKYDIHYLFKKAIIFENIYAIDYLAHMIKINEPLGLDNGHDDYPIIIAIESFISDDSVIKRLVQLGADINIKKEFRTTYGKKTIINMLLSCPNLTYLYKVLKKVGLKTSFIDDIRIAKEQYEIDHLYY